MHARKTSKRDMHACLLFPRKPVAPVIRMPLFLKYPGILLVSSIVPTIFLQSVCVPVFVYERQRERSEREKSREGERHKCCYSLVLEKVYVVTDERHRAHQMRVLTWVFMAHNASRPPKAVQVVLEG